MIRGIFFLGVGLIMRGQRTFFCVVTSRAGFYNFFFLETWHFFWDSQFSSVERRRRGIETKKENRLTIKLKGRSRRCRLSSEMRATFFRRLLFRHSNVLLVRRRWGGSADAIQLDKNGSNIFQSTDCAA